MTTPSEPPHDPTMEEILASIRKIISEDQPGSIKPKGSDLRSGNGSADILELTDEVPEEASGIPRSSASGEPMPAPGAAQPDKRDPVLSDSSLQAIGHAFETLDKASQQFSAFSGGMLETVFSRSVQEAVAPNLREWVSSNETQLLDSIKPLTREWMDANLPRLVESVVKQEAQEAVAPSLQAWVSNHEAELQEAVKPSMRNWMDATLPQAVAPGLQAWVSDHETQLLEAAKPLMREWMDANLPQLVETVLKQELGRAVTEHLRSRLG